MAKYLLLLRDGEFDSYTREEQQQILAEYMAWTDSLKAQGVHLASEELKPGGRVLSTEQGRIVDGPFTETKEAVGGFFLISAANVDQAMRIARECPHFNYGGTVELREVNPH